MTYGDQALVVPLERCPSAEMIREGEVPSRAGSVRGGLMLARESVTLFDLSAGTEAAGAEPASGMLATNSAPPSGWLRTLMAPL